MSIQKKKLLIISHDASRTGAPILLLNLASVLKIHYQISFLINRPNLTILDRFREYECYVASRKPGRVRRFMNRFQSESRETRRVSYDLGTIKRTLADVNCVISNTLTNGDLLPIVRRFYDGTLVTYVHELPMASKYFTTEKELKNVINLSDQFLVPCSTVGDFLEQQLKVPRERIGLLEYYIPDTWKAHSRKGTRPFVVGGVGTSDWRKGADLFVQLAKLVFSRQPKADIMFQWIGARTGLDLERLCYDVEKSGLEGKVELLPQSDSLGQFYSTLSLFALTSREDPYPLVVLEAANSKVPTVCFDGAGGAPEFVVNSGGGRVIDYLNLDEMAGAVLDYYGNPEMAIEHGQKAYSMMVGQHQNKESILRQFDTWLNTVPKERGMN